MNEIHKLQKEYYSRIRQWTKACPGLSKGNRIPEKIKFEAVRIADLGQQIQESRGSSAARLGFAGPTMSDWTKLFPAGETAPLFKLDRSQHESTIELTLPSGIRVTGITAKDAAELLKLLS